MAAEAPRGAAALRAGAAAGARARAGAGAATVAAARCAPAEGGQAPADSAACARSTLCSRPHPVRRGASGVHPASRWTLIAALGTCAPHTGHATSDERARFAAGAPLRRRSPSPPAPPSWPPPSLLPPPVPPPRGTRKRFIGGGRASGAAGGAGHALWRTRGCAAAASAIEACADPTSLYRYCAGHCLTTQTHAIARDIRPALHPSPGVTTRSSASCHVRAAFAR